VDAPVAPDADLLEAAPSERGRPIHAIGRGCQNAKLARILAASANLARNDRQINTANNPPISGSLP